MQKIVTHLWFDMEAEEAINFYVSVFKNSKILGIQYYPEGIEEEHMKGMEGKILHAEFELDGVKFMALDGGPIFKFNEATSLYVECDGQAEVDELWGKLSAVPESEQCGWLKDKYGVSWQIIPKQMGEILMGSDKAGADRAMMAMLQMKKIDVAALQAAYDGK